jgi:hypothetical protein
VALSHQAAWAQSLTDRYCLLGCWRLAAGFAVIVGYGSRH